MEDKNTAKETLHTALEKLTGIVPNWTNDVRGNLFAWLRLPNPEKLAEVAQLLKNSAARLCTVTAYAEERDAPAHKQAIAYHFTVSNMTVTITTPVYDADKDVALSVPSITPWFANADWNEREFHEMFNINIVGHPNPQRLFLDERLDAGIMSTLLPFSALVHGAATRNLWEQVMAAKGVDIAPQEPGIPHLMPEGERAEPVEEPKFTPVSATEPGAEHPEKPAPPAE